MRRGNDPQPPTTRRAPLDGEPTMPPAYDWTKFGRHRLRAPDGTMIKAPRPRRVRAAGVGGHDVARPRCRRRLGPRPAWQPHPREPAAAGASPPPGAAAGDVLEFGADTPLQPIRWYGIMDSYEVDRWATVQGPYPHPGAAYDEAQRLLTLERYVPPLESEPATEREPCHRSHRDRAEATAPTPVVGARRKPVTDRAVEAAGAERGSQPDRIHR